MKVSVLLMSAAIASALLGAAGPLTVGAPDGSGNVTVTIGGTGSGDQALIAAWANGDKGDDPLDWAEYADAGTVAAADTSKTFQIPAAWRAKSGAVKFFLMSGPKPYGKRFDYITRPNCNDGGLYIDTGIVPDTTVDMTVKVQTSSFSGMVPFGIHKAIYVFPNGSSGNAYWFSFFGADNPRISQMQFGDDDPNVFGNPPPKNSDPHTFRISKDGIWVDGYRHLGPFNENHFTNTTTSSIYLFARNGSWKQKGTTCSIYSATIITNGVLAADFVPVAAESGIVQMWNRVTRQCSGRSGSQTDTLQFTAGNDIGPYPPDCGTVESVSAALGLGPEMLVLSRNRQDCTVTVGLSASHDAGLLFACSGAEDAGTTCSAWTTNVLLQKVAANAASVTVTLPDSWWREKRRVRFAWKSMAGKPYDYEVVSLNSDATSKARIRTGWTPTTNTTVRVDAKVGYDTSVFGLHGAFCILPGNKSGNSVPIQYVFFKSASDGSTTCNGSYSQTAPDEFLDSYHEWRLGPGGVYVDGTRRIDLTGLYAPNDAATAGIVLPFRTGSKEDDTYVTKEGDASVRWAKIWQGDEIVYDLVPVVKNAVPGFYDKVRGVFKQTVTSQPFVAGEMVAPDGDFVSWSSACSLASGLTVIFR